MDRNVNISMTFIKWPQDSWSKSLCSLKIKIKIKPKTKPDFTVQFFCVFLQKRNAIIISGLSSINATLASLQILAPPATDLNYQYWDYGPIFTITQKVCTYFITYTLLENWNFLHLLFSRVCWFYNLYGEMLGLQ